MKCVLLRFVMVLLWRSLDLRSKYGVYGDWGAWSCGAGHFEYAVSGSSRIDANDIIIVSGDAELLEQFAQMP